MYLMNDVLPPPISQVFSLCNISTQIGVLTMNIISVYISLVHGRYLSYIYNKIYRLVIFVPAIIIIILFLLIIIFEVSKEVLW